MTRRLLRVDRLVVVVLALALVALGLLALDWRYHEVFTYADVLETGPALDVLDSTWWPWAFAGGGLALGLLGLWLLLAHLRRPGPSLTRLRSGDETGRVEADLRSVADVAARRLGRQAPLTGLKGTTRTHRHQSVVEIRGHVDAAADTSGVAEAVEACVAEVAAAFPDGDVTCRVVLDAPRRTRTGRADRVRVG